MLFALQRIAMRTHMLFCLIAMLLSLAFGDAHAIAQTTLRVGHFPNITHAQALVAHALSRQGKGWFERHLGGDVKIEWYVYNAGPSAMEAIFAKSIDLTYVGPNPAINAYAKSRGDEVRIVAGAPMVARRWSCRPTPRSRHRPISAAKPSRRRNSATRKMSLRAPGSRPAA